MRRVFLATALLVDLSCGKNPARSSSDEERAAESRILASTRPDQDKAKASKQEKVPSPSKAPQKSVHDVFSMGGYRVDLSSKEGHCYAEIYAHGDPIYGPNLRIPLGMKAPCFVRRRVQPMPSKAGSKTQDRLTPLGGPYLYRHKKGSSRLIVTMLIGEPLSAMTLDFKAPSSALRCGQKWVYFSEHAGQFGISEPRVTKTGVCALKVYIDHMKIWGFDRSYLGDKHFSLPKPAKGRVILDDQKGR